MASNTNVLFRYDVADVDTFLSNSYYFLDGKIYFYSEETGNYFLNGILDFNLNDIISNNVYNISENELITQGYLKKYVFETNYTYDSSVVDFTKLLYQQNQFDGKDFYFISSDVGLTNPDIAVGSEVIKVLNDSETNVTNTDFYLITDSANVTEANGEFIYLTGIFSEAGVNKLFLIRGLVSKGNQITYLDVFYDTLNNTSDSIKNIKFHMDESNRINMLVMKDDDTLNLEFFRYNGAEFDYIPNGYSPINLNESNYDFMFTTFSYDNESYYCIKQNNDIIVFNTGSGAYTTTIYKSNIYNNGTNFFINFMNSRFTITEDEQIRIIDIENLINGDLNYGNDIGVILLSELKQTNTDELIVSAVYPFMNKYVVMTNYSFMVFEIASDLLGIRHYEEEDLVEFTRMMPDFINNQDEVQAFFDLFEKYLNNNYYNHYDETDLDIHRFNGYEDLWWCSLVKDDKGNIVYKNYLESEAGSTDKFFQSKYGIHSLNGRTFYQTIKELAYVKDPYLINIDFIGYLARFLGYDFSVDVSDFKKLINTFSTNTFNNLNYKNTYDRFRDDEDSTVIAKTVDSYIRFIVCNLPYWKKIKGTTNMVETLLMVFGVSSFIQKMASVDYKMFYTEFLNSGVLVDGREISTPHLDITVDLDEVDIDNDILDSFDSVFKMIDDILPINVVSDGFGAKIDTIMNISMLLYSRTLEQHTEIMTADNVLIDSNYNPLFEVLDIGDELPSLKKYGFDFDGNTNIITYINPTLNTENTEISFSLKKELETDAYIYNSSSEINIGFDDTNKLYFKLNLPSTDEFYLTSLSSINVNDIINVKILLISDGTNLTIEMYINDLLQSNQTNASNIESFEFSLDDKGIIGAKSNVINTYENDFVFGSSGTEINQFDYSYGITVYNDKIYIADTGNNRIVITELDGTWITSFGSSGSSDNEFKYPYGITVYNDKIYICDRSNNRIVITELDGTWITSFGTQGIGINEFKYPNGISVYNDKIYIADTDNHRIVITELDGTWITSFGSRGSGGSSYNEFSFPNGISVYNDKIYICDRSNDRVVITELDGTLITSFGTEGIGINQFNSPNGITVYNDKIYICDTYSNDRIVITELDGTWITSFGSSGSSDNEFTTPYGISVYNDKIYIADRENFRISIWNIINNISYSNNLNSSLANFTVKTNGEDVFNESFDNEVKGEVTGTEQYALISSQDIGDINDGYIVKNISNNYEYTNEYIFGYDQDNWSRGVSVYNNRIYTTDTTNDRIVITDLDGSNWNSFGSVGSGVNKFNNPTGVSVYNNRIYITDNSNRRIVITDLDGSNWESFGNFNDYRSPWGICVYGDKIYNTDEFSDRIVITDLDGSNYTTFGSYGNGINQFNNPTGVSVYNNRIYILDSGNNRVVITDLDGGNWESFGSTGTGINNFNNPSDISVYNNRIYITDKSNSRIVATDLDGSNWVSFGDERLSVTLSPLCMDAYEDNLYIMNGDIDNKSMTVWSINQSFTLSNNDELYKYYDSQWNQLDPFINYTVKNLADNLFYKYINTGTFNEFIHKVEHVTEVLDIVTTVPTNIVNFNEAYIYRSNDDDKIYIYNGTSWEGNHSFIGKQIKNLNTNEFLEYKQNGSFKQFVPIGYIPPEITNAMITDDGVVLITDNNEYITIEV